MGEQAAMPTLYARVLAEMARVTRVSGRVVLLTSEWSALKGALHGRRELAVVRTVRDVEVLGRRADMVLLTRV